jgi:hypothetical protein
MVVGGVDQVLVVGSKMEHGDEPYLARKVVSSLRPGPLRAMLADKLASRLAAPFSLSRAHRFSLQIEAKASMVLYVRVAATFTDAWGA